MKERISGSVHPSASERERAHRRTDEQASEFIERKTAEQVSEQANLMSYETNQWTARYCRPGGAREGSVQGVAGDAGYLADGEISYAKHGKSWGPREIIMGIWSEVEREFAGSGDNWHR